MADGKTPGSWRLGEILVQNGWVTWENLEKALEIQRRLNQQELNPISAGAPSTRTAAQGLSIGETLVRYGWLSWDQLKECLKIQRMSSRMLGDVLVEKGYISAKDLTRGLAIHFGMQFVDFDTVSIPEDVVKLVPKRVAYDYKVMPLVKKGPALLVAIANPKKVEAEAELKRVVRDCAIHTALAMREEIEEAILNYYGPE